MKHVLKIELINIGQSIEVHMLGYVPAIAEYICAFGGLYILRFSFGLSVGEAMDFR